MKNIFLIFLVITGLGVSNSVKAITPGSALKITVGIASGGLALASGLATTSAFLTLKDKKVTLESLPDQLAGQFAAGCLIVPLATISVLSATLSIMAFKSAIK